MEVGKVKVEELHQVLEMFDSVAFVMVSFDLVWDRASIISEYTFKIRHSLYALDLVATTT